MSNKPKDARISISISLTDCTLHDPDVAARSTAADLPGLLEHVSQEITARMSEHDVRTWQVTVEPRVIEESDTIPAAGVAHNEAFCEELAMLIRDAHNISILKALPMDVIARVVDQVVPMAMAQYDPANINPAASRAAFMVCGILDETSLHLTQHG